MSFQFLKFDRLAGEDIDLIIDEKVPADEAKGWVPAYKYNIVLHNTTTIVGQIDIRIGYQESLYFGGHIGYTVLEKYRGNHFAGKACLLLKQVALQHGMDKVIVTCNPDNYPSRKTCEYVGAVLREIVNLPPHNDIASRHLVFIGLSRFWT
ncbi:GNAT family N-acetyltransferase [Alicyclobacillus fastidiosus]|uniref:GNAT family N-acetyltransferase n=1 Tax=Alicyclobacillus fastidiosus TaxID=392011 RepID=A0ABY6ZI78_9BACL|nr:GNAT family N-acetyltransferase [Alicyclobacillus fastidiosus]WAH42460.1 GNAT family N-acetyltransferase [Alicyclobacillus fastidiosus]GMA64293.1 hypothetical protein GCM10025859_47330 [Alicyclobacillus fastidiosus]